MTESEAKVCLIAIAKVAGLILLIITACLYISHQWTNSEYCRSWVSGNQDDLFIFANKPLRLEGNQCCGEVSVDWTDKCPLPFEEQIFGKCYNREIYEKRCFEIPYVRTP